MQIAHNPETGEYLGLQNGQWSKLQVAANDAGQKLYLGPDGWLPLDTGSAANPNSPAQERGAGRSLGLGTRNVMEGIGGLVGSVTSPFANVVDWAMGGSGRRFGNPGAAVADALGLPTPQNSTERVLGNVIEGAAGIIPTLGAGAALQAAGRAPQIAAALSEAPILQAVSGALGGGASGVAQEGGFGVPAQVGAGLAAGALPFFGAAAANTVGRGIRSMAGAADRMTESGQQRLAGTAFERMAKDPAGVRAALSDGTDGVLVPGSLPTTAQRVADPGISLLEKAMQQTPEGWAIRERYTAQQDAQREALNNLLNPVGKRQNDNIAAVSDQLAQAAPYGGNLDSRMAGGMIRSAFDDAYGNMRKQVGEAYNAIDPSGTASFDLRPLAQSFQEIVGNGRYQRTPKEVTDLLGQMSDDIKNGVNVTYRDLQDMRTLMSDLSFQASKTGDAATNRIATGMRRAIDDYMERSSMNPELMGGSPMPQQGSPNYKAASAVARDALSSDAWYSDLDALMRTGLNRDATERLIGASGIEDLNRLAPGLVRKNGRMMPDTAASELGSFESLIQQTGGGSYHADADAFLQALQDRLSGMYGRKRQAFQNMRDNVLQDSGAPHTGFTPDQAAAFQYAKELRRQQGAQFEQGANRPLTLNGNLLEGERIADSAIPGNYFKPGGAGSEGMDAFYRSVGSNDGANLAMVDHVAQNAIAASTKDGVLNPNSLAGWLERYRPALSQFDATDLKNALETALSTQRQNFAARDALGTVARQDRSGNWQLAKAQRQFPAIPGDAGLTPSETAQLAASQQDLKRVLDTANMAGVSGSPTAQLTRVMNDLGRLKSGTMGGGGMVRNILNDVISRLTAHADDKIENMLIQGVLDPEYALKLMSNTNNMPGNGLLDSARRWTGSGGGESYADMLKRYGVATTVGAGRTPAQAEQKRK